MDVLWRFFCRNRNFVRVQRSTLENSTLSVDIVQSVILNNFKNKYYKNPANWHFTKEKKTNSSYNSKMMPKFWKLD